MPTQSPAFSEDSVLQPLSASLWYPSLHRYGRPGSTRGAGLTRRFIVLTVQRTAQLSLSAVRLWNCRRNSEHPRRTASRKAEGAQFRGIAETSDRHNDVLLAIEHICHRRPALLGRHVDRACFFACLLVISAEH